MWRLLGALFLLGWMHRGAEARCYSDEQCLSWEVCTVSFGECSGDGPADVCVGQCVSSHALRAIGRAGLLVTDGGVETDLGLEVVPPFLGGHLALAADYVTSDLWRLGLALRVPIPAALNVGLRTDWIAGAPSTTGAVASRLEWTPLRYVSALIEAGLMISDGDRAGFGTFGVAVWSPSLFNRSWNRPGR